jgi:hypothetical protein
VPASMLLEPLLGAASGDFSGWEQPTKVVTHAPIIDTCHSRARGNGWSMLGAERADIRARLESFLWCAFRDPQTDSLDLCRSDARVLGRIVAFETTSRHFTHGSAGAFQHEVQSTIVRVTGAY